MGRRLGRAARIVAVAAALLITASRASVDAAMTPATPVPAGAVAMVHGTMISFGAYRHWVVVAVDSSTPKRQNRIIPLAPPRFADCVAQSRAKNPSLRRTPETKLRSDCAELFTSTNATVLDFLIKGLWYQLEAKRLHIVVTAAEVRRAFAVAKHQQFKTQQQYEAFLRETGQTTADILYRVRVNQDFSRLEARHATPVTPATIARYYHSHLSQFSSPDGSRLTLAQATPLIRELLTSKEQEREQAAVDRIAARHWHATTICSPLYAIADCAGAQPRPAR